MCFGGGQKTQKSSVTVTTPPPTQQETEAQGLATYMQQIDLWKMGYETYRDEKGQLQARSRPLTSDEEAAAGRNKEMEDFAYRKMKGEVTPQEQALIDQAYGSAIATGKSDIRAEFDRALEELKIGEGRGYQDIQSELTRGTEDINQAYRTDAAERGLSQGATPILGERAKSFQKFGEDVNQSAGRLAEDVNRNKRIMGEDLTRNVTDLETSLLGAKSGATLDTMRSGQLFAQSLKEFQAGLQQQSFLNRQMIGEGFSNTAATLGNLRSKNYTQTSKGSATGGSSGFLTAISGISSLMGGSGGLLQGIGGMMKV